MSTVADWMRDAVMMGSVVMCAQGSPVAAAVADLVGSRRTVGCIGSAGGSAPTGTSSSVCSGLLTIVVLVPAERIAKAVSCLSLT